MFCPSWKPKQLEKKDLQKKLHWLTWKKLEIECFAIQTDKKIEHQRADIVVIDKEKRECKIINKAVSGDQNIRVKELEESLNTKP